jgi:hypothetical protein
VLRLGSPPTKLRFVLYLLERSLTAKLF